MNKSLHILFSAIVALLLVVSACKKKKEDTPIPYNSAGEYRIDYYTIESNSFQGKIDFTYNTNKQLIQLTTVNNDGQTVQLETYEYNNKGLKSSYKDVRGTDITTYRYEYNTNDLISAKYYYTGNDLTDPTESASYYYDSQNNMISLVRKNYSGSLFKDSSAYDGFSNGRPTLATSYISYANVNGGAYAISRKEKYTYDGRMNLLLKEETLDNDLNVYYSAREYTYKPHTNEMQAVIQYTKNTYDQREYGLGADQDLVMTANSSYESSCNTTYAPAIRSSEKVTTSEFNANNLLSKIIRVLESFDGCGNVTNTTTITAGYYYEKL